MAAPRWKYKLAVWARLRASTVPTAGPPPGPGLSRISPCTSSSRSASRSEALLTSYWSIIAASSGNRSPGCRLCSTMSCTMSLATRSDVLRDAAARPCHRSRPGCAAVPRTNRRMVATRSSRAPFDSTVGQNTGGATGRPPDVMPAARASISSAEPSWVTIQNSIETDGVDAPAGPICSGVRAVDGSSSWVGRSSRESAPGSPPGRLRALSAIRVGTTPGHSTDTPIGAPGSAQLHVEGLRDRHDAGLGDVVRRDRRRRDQPGDRRRVDDVGRLALAQHDRHERAHAVDHAPQVDAEHPPPVGERLLPRRARSSPRRRCCTRRARHRSARTSRRPAPPTAAGSDTSVTTAATSAPVGRRQLGGRARRARSASTSASTTDIPLGGELRGERPADAARRRR